MSGTMSNEVQFNDGEGLILTDLHDMQRFLKSTLLDQILGQMGSKEHTYDNLPPSDFQKYLIVPHASSGYPRPNGTLTVTNMSGTIMQWSVVNTVSDGLTPKLLTYCLVDDELSTVFAVGNATNPRIDAICVKLTFTSDQDPQTRNFKDATTGVVTSQTENKKGRVLLTKQVVQGTPASNPVYPTIPSGYAVYAYAYIPANFNSAMHKDNTWDNRVPMHVRTARTFAKDAIITTGSPTLSAGKLYINHSTAGNAATLWLFPGSSDSRIIAVNIYGVYQNDVNIGINVVRVDLLGSDTTTGIDVAIGNFGRGKLTNPFTSYYTNVLDGPPVAVSAMGVGPVLWGNSFPAGIYWQNAGANLQQALGILIATNVSTAAGWKFSAIDWVYAC